MHVRRLEIFGIAAAFAGGTAITPGVTSGDAGRMLVTFLGLVSASLLPTISLLVNGMTASGRSVHAIEKLDRELQAAMDALFLLFGCTAVTFAALLALAISPPGFVGRVPYLASEVLPRLGQGIVVAALAIITFRAGQIPAILRRSLAMRKEIALDEARRKIQEKAPETAAVRLAFPTHADFGKTVNLDEVTRQ